MAKDVVKALSGPVLPKLFAPDPEAARRFLEFFTANIRNPNTRRAYARAAVQFAVWCEENDLRELVLEAVADGAILADQAGPRRQC
jgi:hypothetical protein